jgi:3D-(3,5/4)-trihydroxycyclohexane-1,2-dione acylhydrolase (decyclizing)
MTTVRLTAAQAMIRYLANQYNEDSEQYFAGIWAIFGHGNVAGLGEALHSHRDQIKTLRGQNEQSMAHAAIAFAKQLRRKRTMAVTSSIGPGALNMVTAAALAHVNRLPVLFIPGDVFANRGPDPVLQQVEDFTDGTVSANDCFRPVSRYFDRIQRPEQILTALPRAMRTLIDPADCGPVTLSFCQDVQAEAFDYPVSFFEKRVWKQRRPEPDAGEFAAALEALQQAKSPVIVAGGGVHFSGATEELRDFAQKHHIPVVETQAGKSALPWDHPNNFGPVGVTGADSANFVSEKADLVIGVGTRFQDFTTGSWSLFKNPNRKILALNVQPYDSHKHDAISLIADAKIGLNRLSQALGDRTFTPIDETLKAKWFAKVDPKTDAPAEGDTSLPTDMQVIGAVQRQSRENSVVMCAAGTMPGELHQLWKAGKPMSYHMEYGFSCMGYEVAGGLGIKLAEPERDVTVMVGDGSYMMMNSELATAVAMGVKLTLVITDNRGYGCINRLQMGTGGAEFNNLYDHTNVNAINIDFAAHAASMGAKSVKVSTIAEFERELARARDCSQTNVIVIDTDPYPTPEAGGHFWDVAVPEVSVRDEVIEARKRYDENLKERI